MNKRIKTEILAPAGSFEKAVYAFEGGADAVYVGLEKFSARHFSANFGFSELEKLKKIATEQNKKIYITLNTVIKEDEIADVIKFLIEIEIIGVDGVIIQDFGVLHLLKNYFPTLDIHASTQMAIHNSTGVRLAKKLGFSRVVLARELSFEEIYKIRKDNPDIELEVFIHGSLCYSFSGCCLVSGLTVSSNRSANRGKCSQVCRTWFEKNGKKNSQNGYYYSLKDLSLDENIKKLVDIGIDSLKIEGRMKNSVYTKFSSKYYRSLLDNSNSNEIANNKDQLKFGFSRKETSFFFDSQSPSSLTDSNYAGHYGNKIGYISKISTKKNNIGFYVKFNNKDKEVSKRDGILFFDNKTGKPINISVDSHLEKNGFIRSLAKVDINDPIYLTSKSNLNLKVIDARSFKAAKKRVTLDISLKKRSNNLVSLNFSYKLETVNSCSVELSFEIEFEEAKSSRKSLKSVFEESLNKNLYYLFKLNFSSGENENIFIRLSDLKGIKKRLVAEIDDAIVKHKEDKYFAITNNTQTSQCFTGSETLTKSKDFDLLNVSLEVKHSVDFRSELRFNNLPFITEFDKENSFKLIENIFFTSISLIQLDSDENKLFITQLSEYVNSNKDKKFCIGLNNISHLILLEKIVGTNCTFFLDFYIYTANINTASFFYNYDKRIKFAYYWIESDEYDNNKNILSEYNIYPIKNKKEMKPPLFYSRVCFAKESMGISCENCKKSFTFILSQNNKDKTVIVKNCITYVI